MNDGRSRTQGAIEAVGEVGNPTIVATLTVVAALLPMLFVSGMMGPYMSPIPANASAAMIFSFFVAVILTPWLMLKRWADRAVLPMGTVTAKSACLAGSTCVSPGRFSPPGRGPGSFCAVGLATMDRWPCSRRRRVPSSCCLR